MTRKKYCTHGKEKYYCFECGGKGVCKHQIRRSRCKECGGSEICVHGRLRYHCADCSGKGICKHRKQRHFCKICNVDVQAPEKEKENEITDESIFSRELLKSDQSDHISEADKIKCAKLYAELNSKFTEEDVSIYSRMFDDWHARNQTSYREV